ncbi:MAG TPA: alpha/beta hydrolase [Egibacteraceae bacterium]|nr:alpha/beta hydrolase [Egibacteraceae bacterium]
MQRVAVVAALAVVGLAAAAWLLQRNLLYFPSRHLLPAPAGVEEVAFETSDGLVLGAWFFPASGAHRGAVLVCNGNAGNRSHRARLAEALRERGWSVLLYDYRGYGGNPGRPSERGLARDAAAAAEWLAQRDDVDSKHIVYFGESLGAAVATGLAVERPPAVLILRSPFTSLEDMVRVHYRFAPAGLLLRDRFPVVDLLDRYGGPVLVIAGSEDVIVPPAQSAAVAEAASDAHHVVIPGAGHNDPALLDGEDLINAITEFLSERI